MENKTTTGQMSLIGFIDDGINRVFGSKELKNGKGETVGTTFAPRGRKDLAIALELKGKNNKEALDAAVLKQQDEAFRIVKGQIAGLDGNWTLGRVTQRVNAAGVRSITVAVKEVKRATGPSDEAIAKSLGISVDEVKAMRARQTEALAGKTIEMESEAKTGASEGK